MKREFNVTGSCNPKYHYMVDTSAKYEHIFNLIERRKYFAINRPRQYGKTTMLDCIRQDLWKRKGDYVLSQLSFEGVGDAIFEKEETFSARFVELFARSLKYEYSELEERARLLGVNVVDLDTLAEFIEAVSFDFKRKIVVLIDEVDKSSNSQTFLSFLGMLRTKYLKANSGLGSTFHSVILAGVHDVKSLKLQIREGEETKLNSPWNIAADFNVDMSFSIPEIKTLLEDYLSENEAEMDVDVIAERLHYYTNGYPFLVSKLCKNIDEEADGNCPDFQSNRWLVSDVDWAFKWLTRPMYQTTNFDDMIKNLENNSDLYKLVSAIGVEGEDFSAAAYNPVVNLGVTYGILEQSGGHIVISNRVYEQVIATYLQSKKEFEELTLGGPRFEVGYISESRLDLRLILTKFQEFMKEHYSDKDASFLECEGRLIFMSFLKPIINGKGFMWKEPVVGDERRMDLVLTYGEKQKEVVELKIWRGEKYHEKGLQQFGNYLSFQSVDRGYLLIFNFNRNKTYKQEELRVDGRDVFVVWV